MIESICAPSRITLSSTFERVWEYAHALVGKEVLFLLEEEWVPFSVTLKTTFKDLIAVKCAIDEDRMPGDFKDSALGQLPYKSGRDKRPLFPKILVKKVEKL